VGPTQGELNVKKIICAIILGLAATPAFADTITLQELGQSVHSTSSGKLISIFSGNTADGLIIGVVQADNTVVTTPAYTPDNGAVLATEMSVANLVCDLTREWNADGGSILCVAL
jgi:hypothetical protein